MAFDFRGIEQRLIQRVLAKTTDIGASIREDQNGRNSLRIFPLFLDQQANAKFKSGGKGRPSADGKVLDAFRRVAQIVAQRQQDIRAGVPEGDHAELVTVQVQIIDEGANDSLGNGHAIIGAHGGARVDDHHQCQACLAGALAQAQVIFQDFQDAVSPAVILIGRGSPQGCNERQVIGFFAVFEHAAAKNGAASLRIRQRNAPSRMISQDKMPRYPRAQCSGAGAEVSDAFDRRLIGFYGRGLLVFVLMNGGPLLLGAIDGSVLIDHFLQLFFG